MTIPAIPNAANPPRMDGVPAPVVEPIVEPTVPVVPTPVPEDKPAVVKDESAPAVLEDFSTGNVGLDAALQAFVTSTGATSADLNKAVALAIEHSNPDLIDQAFLKQKFGVHADQALTLAKAAVAEDKTQTERIQRESIDIVHTAAGGEAQWKQAVSVFNTSANKETKAAVIALMDSGNMQDGAALVIQTVQASGLVPAANPLLHGGNGVTTAGNALTKTAFKAEMEALTKLAGNSSLESGKFAPQYEALLTRRRAGLQLNL
jgi:hypothetical protein